MWFHKKYLDNFFIQTIISMLEKKIVEKLLSIERWQELFWNPLYQNPFYMFIKILDELLFLNPPKYTKKQIHFLA
jgi:hypothetical protein